MQPGKHSFSMFGRFLSINPPQPELLFDVKREHKANSDCPDGYPSLHDFSHNNCFATYQNGILKSPELYFNPWRILRAEVGAEYQELKTGVFHITKLPAKQQFNLADISCDIAKFKGFGSKLGIFISSDKPFVASDIRPRVIIMDGANGTNYQGAQKLNAGMNIWDLTNEPVNINPEESGRGAYLSFPSSWWNTDESGNPAVTPCDIYVVFFPVLDESECNGYGEYLVPKFNDSFWNKKVEEIVLNDDGLTVDTTLATDAYDLLYSPTPYYSDDYIIVYSPEFLNVYSSTNADIIFEALTYSTSDGYSLLYSETLGSTNGKNTPFYGCVIFKGDHTSFPNQIRFSSKGVFTMLPYNNDRFTVAYSGNNTNVAAIQVNETTPFHDKCELQTLITKYRNTYKGSSILYRNEVLSTTEDLLGIYGFRLSSYSATSTQFSHRHCICDAAQGRWENLVSYCNNQIVTNQITDYELLYKDTVSAVVLLNNEEITDEDCSDTGSRLFSCIDGNNCFSGQLYYLIAFKERLTPWQIAWALSHLV